MTDSLASAAVVLLSGGLDSTTVMAWALAEGRCVHALSFSYGQRHQVELAYARRQAERMGARSHRVVELEQMSGWAAKKSSLVGASALTVPLDRKPSDTDIPNTYVPARNTLFLSYALALAECEDANEIWIGVNALDYSGYPDCRPEFVRAFEKLANLATRAGVEQGAIRIRAPLQDLRKSEIILKAGELGVDLSDTLSCYAPHFLEDGSALACGRCESCRLRQEGFAAANQPDPTRYVSA